MLYKKIDVIDLLTLQNPYVIDVREPNEFKMGHIKDAINIPVNEIIENYEKYLYKGREYYIYCETNIRSSSVCKFLSGLGYDVILLDGGYKEWTKNINKF